MPEQPTDEQYRPLALVAVIAGALLLFSVFFIGFLVAPLAILLVFYVVFSAVDRSRKGSGGHAPAAVDEPEAPRESAADALAREVAERRAAVDRLGAVSTADRLTLVPPAERLGAVPDRHPDRPAP